MSKWILVAAILQGGVWVPGAEDGFANRHFETLTACTVMRDQQNRLGRNLYRRFECVTPGERHSLLPSSDPVTALEHPKG